MNVRELQAEAKSRGLATSRVRAELIQRLTDHDEQQTNADDGEHELSADVVRKGTVTAEAVSGATIAPAGTRAFRREFDAEPGGPDEETHLAYRQATVQAAIEAGHQPRGDARLTATVDGRWVYEVSVRQVT